MWKKKTKAKPSISGYDPYNSQRCERVVQNIAVQEVPTVYVCIDSLIVATRVCCLWKQ